MQLLAFLPFTLSWAWLLPCMFLLWLCSIKLQHIGLPPGPFSWPLVGCAFSLKQPLHKQLAMLAAKYGPVMYLKAGATPTIVVSNSSVAKEVLTTRDQDFAFRPPTKTFDLLSNGSTDLAFTHNIEAWRALRKACVVHLFSSSKVNDTSPLREAEIRSIVLLIIKFQGKCIKLRPILGEYSSSSICLMLFGKKQAATKLVELIENLQSTMLTFNIGDFFPLLDGFDFHGTYRKLRKEVMPPLVALLTKLVHERREENHGGILDASLDEDFIIGLMIDMFLGGIETSQGTTEWAMAEVLNNSLILNKAQQELDHVVGKKRLVQESDFPNLHYMHAIIKETLRMHPVGPLGVPHYNPKATMIAGYKIPAKCRLVLNLWAIGRDPANWENPNEFKPERFLGSDINVTGRNFEVIPFSAGRRTCIGYPLAMRSITLAVATLIHALEWKTTVYLDLEEDKVGVMSTKLGSELIASASPRLDESAYV